MTLKPLTERVRRVAMKTDTVLLLELASGAVLLAWAAHLTLE
jgi:hypothetical protein